MYVPDWPGSCPPALTVGLAQCPRFLPTGLIGDIYLNDTPLKKFKIYSLDMKKSFFQRWAPCLLPPRRPQAALTTLTAFL